jgi:glucoamylase
METLDRWIDRQYRLSMAKMLPAISAVDLVKHRPGFGTSVRAAKGSIVASPVLASYDPDPDYFFHWFRDSAVIIDAVRLLMEDGSLPKDQALQIFDDFLRFSLSLFDVDGRGLVTDSAWRKGVQPDFAKFIRTDAEFAAVKGGLVSAEARVNPDGTLDISNWGRPQHDGPPLRLLSVLRWNRPEAAPLIRADIAFTRGRWRIPSIDIWEEEKGYHYYTLRVSAAALEEGAKWLDSQGDRKEAELCRAEAREIKQQLDGYWLPDQGYYRSRILEGGERSRKELDIAVIFAAIHCDVHDERMQSTLRKLEELFDADYPINHKRTAARGPALGRYKGDVYYSGGAYYFSTLAGAEFCYRAGQRERGDAYLETVRAYTPPSGDLSEQFDQKTGEQTSAKHLAWSYAAFITAVAARRNG